MNALDKLVKESAMLATAIAENRIHGNVEQLGPISSTEQRLLPALLRLPALLKEAMDALDGGCRCVSCYPGCPQLVHNRIEAALEGAKEGER